MAPVYPRTTLKKTVKAHSGRTMTKGADVLLYLDYVVFMNKLIKEAIIQGKKDGERGLSAKALRKVQGDVLAQFRG